MNFLVQIDELLSNRELHFKTHELFFIVFLVSLALLEVDGVRSSPRELPFYAVFISVAMRIDGSA